MHVLRGLGRRKSTRALECWQYSHQPWIDNDMITMFEEAYKKQPHHEDLGVQTFFAIVRTGNWKAAQQVCPVISIMPVSYQGHAARYENAQAVPGRSLHLLECHKCCTPGESTTRMCNIYPHDPFPKGQRSIYSGVYASRTLQTLTSIAFLDSGPFPPFCRSFLSPP